MGYDNSHSQLVGWAKIVLPLGALALLSTLFLFSNRIDPSAAIPYAQVDVEKLARESALTRPEFSSVTQDGGTLTVTAEQARPEPDNGGGASAQQLIAKLTAKDGLVTDLSASQGRFDTAAGEITLQGSVAMQTSQGYHLTSDLIEMRTDYSKIVSPGPVQGGAPFGTLEAGSMTMTAPKPGGDDDLVFNKGVKLIYQPKQ
jgi:lipopolysaccharide export system protein LptC